MSKKHHLTFILLLVASTLVAQQFSIKGKLVDRDAGYPLESATIFAETIQDSTLISYSLSERDGSFLLKGNTNATEIHLFISYTGYERYKEHIVFKSQSREVDLGELRMAFESESLSEIVIQAIRAPVLIKKDTLEFNAASFKTKQDANVEDLLRQLPGVEVDNDGNILVNGVAVTNILVNGEPFFGDDLTVATKNLPKDIIDKIQVVDTRTKTEEFTGQEGDQETKTINITIDKDKNRGVFGRLSAGYGTDERYQISGIGNYFNNDQRFTLLGGSNNVNAPAFSSNEVTSLRRGSTGSGNFSQGGSASGSGGGITTSSSIGGNFSDKLSEKTKITADYFYSTSETEDEIITERENFIPENRFFTNSLRNTLSATENHKTSVNFETQPDSTLKIIVRPYLNYTNSQSVNEDVTASTDEDGQLINSSNSSSYRDQTSKNFRNNLEVVKRLGSKGAFVEWKMTNEINDSDADGFTASTNRFFSEDIPDIDRNQFIEDQSSVTTLSTSVRYQYPLIEKKLFMYVNYGYQINKNNSRYSTFDFNEETQQFSDFNLAQSTDFDFDNITHTPQLGLDYRLERSSFGVRFGNVHRTLKSYDALRDLSFDENFNAFDMRVYARFRFKESQRVRFTYSTNNQPPSLRQLQPFTDVSNPLFIVTGNPDLKPSNTHQFSLNYNNYNIASAFGTYLNGRFSTTSNRIVNNTFINENLIRQTTYINVDGYREANFSGNVNKTFKKDSTSLQLSGGLNGRYIRNVNFTNQQGYTSNNYLAGFFSKIIFNYKNLFELIPSYTVNFSTINFNLAQLPQRDNTSHSLGIQTATFWPKRVEWRNDIFYTYNSDISPGFSNAGVLWNASLGVKLFEDNATLMVQVFDVLKQRNNTTRITSEDYVLDTQSNVLQQYFMFSFTYNLKKIGGASETVSRGRGDRN